MAPRTFAALVSVFATVALWVVPSTGIAAEKGLNVDLTWGVSYEEQDRTIDAIKDSGSEWVRIEIDWHWLAEPELTPGWEWEPARVQALFDRAVRLSDEAGVKVLVMVQRSPMSASGSTIHEAPPTDPQDFALFMTETATRYDGMVEAYELWNEPNFNRFWPSGPNAAQYVELLKAGSLAVREVDPDAEIVFGGTQWSDYRFLEDAYAAEPNLGEYYDVMGVHPYTPPAAPTPEEIRRDPDGRMSKDSFPAYREVRAVMLEHGDDKPIWFTELGWSTSSQDQPGGLVSEEQQADYLKRAFDYIEQDPYVEVAFWYNLRNNWDQYDADTWEGQMGLLRTDFSPKLSFAAFKDVGATDPAPLDQTLSLQVAAMRAERFAAAGRVDHAGEGDVGVLVQRYRRASQRWIRVRRLVATVDEAGKYRATFRLRGHAAWRVTARCEDEHGHAVSRRVRFRT